MRKWLTRNLDHATESLKKENGIWKLTCKCGWVTSDTSRLKVIGKGCLHAKAPSPSE